MGREVLRILTAYEVISPITSNVFDSDGEFLCKEYYMWPFSREELVDVYELLADYGFSNVAEYFSSFDEDEAFWIIRGRGQLFEVFEARPVDCPAKLLFKLKEDSIIEFVIDGNFSPAVRYVFKNPIINRSCGIEGGRVVLIIDLD
jgi:hypothetical protein